MKKINSIDYGGKVIGIGLLIMLILPGMLLGINAFLNYQYVFMIAGFLFLTGAAILICFAVLLLIELRQDKKIDTYYSKHKNIKIRLADGKFECGACGSRTVSEDTAICNMCGCKFESWADRTPQEIINKNV